MGSAGYRMREGRMQALSQVIQGKSQYLVALVGTHKDTKEPAKGACRLFETLDERKIIDYATAESKENRVKLEKIEVYSLKSKLVKEIQIGPEPKKRTGKRNFEF